MNGKTFIYLCGFFFFAVSTAYFLAVDQLAIPDRIIDRSFKQFLLKGSEEIEGRIIIDGGSNATHGIDALMVERHFGMLTPNVADNGSYPLEHKILNYRGLLTENDVVIISLEWRQYIYEERLPENYVASIIDEYGSNSFYYRGLPLLDKLIFVFRHLPYRLAVDSVIGLNGLSSRNSKLSKSEESSLTNFYQFIDNNIRGSSRRNDSEKDVKNGKIPETCDQYLLKGAVARDFTLSERFMGNLKLLQDVAKETGARFIFTWPVVVGRYDNECYTTEKVASNIAGYSSMIREVIEKHGFELLGEIDDSKFDSTCFLDTYYHIRHDCAVVRTERLIDQLGRAGLERREDYSPQATKRILFAYLDQINLEKKDILRPNSPVEGEDLSRYILFRSGWVRQGRSRFISMGKRSGFTLKKGDADITGIKITGKYFNNRGKTKVWVNGKYSGVLGQDDVILDVRGLLAEDGLFNITFEHTLPRSAPGLPGSMGGKQRQYRLTGIELLSE